VPQCPEGSQPKAGAPAFINLGEEEIKSLLGASWSWLGQFIPGLGQVNEQVSLLCAGEPPTDVFTAADLGLLLLPPFGTAVAMAKLRNTILAQAWPNYCECLPAEAPPGTPCVTYTADLGDGTGVTHAACEWPTGCWYSSFPHASGWNAPPSGAHRVTVSVKGIAPGLCGYISDQGGDLQFKCTTGDSDTIDFGPVDMHAGSTNIQFRVFSQGATLPLHVVAKWYPTASEPPCDYLPVYVPPSLPSEPPLLPPPPAFTCADNEDICDKLFNLDVKLNRILTMVTLIQRQETPFGYIESVSHPGLAGSGTLSVQGLIGVRVDLTTIPAYVGRLDGQPTVYFDVGWVALGTATGYQTRELVRHDPQFVLSGEAGIFTRVAYTFPPGVVATIVELVREP